MRTPIETKSKGGGEHLSEQFRSYWAVLPGEVAHDTELTIAAKYLYVILSSMAHKNGFCWPENETLASEMQLSKRRVVELLGMLRDSGYIRIEFRREGREERRYIYCGMFPERAPKGCEIPQGGDAEDSIPPCEKSHPPMREIRNPIKVEKQKEKQKENPPKAPQGAKGSKYALQEEARPLLRAYVGRDQELARALADFIQLREQLRAVNSAAAVKALLNKLDKLSGGDRAVKLQLIQESMANSWKSVFPLKGGRSEPPPVPEGGVDCGWR